MKFRQFKITEVAMAKLSAKERAAAAERIFPTKTGMTDKEAAAWRAERDRKAKAFHAARAAKQAPATPTSFGAAFKAARKTHGGPGGVFTYKGKKYQTNVKGEPYAKNPVPVGTATPAPAKKSDISSMDDTGYVPVAPAKKPTPKPSIDPTDSWVNTGKAAPKPSIDPTDSWVNTGKAAPKATAKAKAAKAVAKDVSGLVMSGYNGMSRLKYLAGIKEKNKNE